MKQTINKKYTEIKVENVENEIEAAMRKICKDEGLESVRSMIETIPKKIVKNIVVLQFRIGEKVYFRKEAHIIPACIISVKLSKGITTYECFTRENNTKKRLFFTANDIGKTFFSTKKEAEKFLKN